LLNQFTQTEFWYFFGTLGMSLVYDHHCKQKNWLSYKNCRSIYIFSLLWNTISLQSSLQTKKLINLQKLQFHISLASYGMTLVYNHHYKQKNWLTYKNCNWYIFGLLWNVTSLHSSLQTKKWLTYKNCNWYIFGLLWNVTILQSSLQTKLLNVHKLESYLICHLFIFIIAYILQNWNLTYLWSPRKWTSFIHNHHCKEKICLMYINWLLIYLLSLISNVTYTIVIIMANKNV
jgi:hypothetical protein